MTTRNNTDEDLKEEIYLQLQQQHEEARTMYRIFTFFTVHFKHKLPFGQSNKIYH
jgi:hypothetical protein